MKITLCLLSSLLVISCSTFHEQAGEPNQQQALYDRIGGKVMVANIVDNFINEIGFNETIFDYFKDSDIDRFREKMIEHLCSTLDGPCQYTGDSMKEVHQGMNINEGDFNLTVDLLINAMTKANLSHTQQNKILARLVPMRREMLYN